MIRETLEDTARNVYLVLGSPGRPRTLRVLLDGKPYKLLAIDHQQLYTLVRLPRAGTHLLELRADPGIRGYAFTFG